MNAETREYLKKERDLKVRELAFRRNGVVAQCELCMKPIPAGGGSGDRRRFCSRAHQREYHWRYVNR